MENPPNDFTVQNKAIPDSLAIQKQCGLYSYVGASSWCQMELLEIE